MITHATVLADALGERLAEIYRHNFGEAQQRRIAPREVSSGPIKDVVVSGDAWRAKRWARRRLPVPRRTVVTK